MVDVPVHLALDVSELLQERQAARPVDEAVTARSIERLVRRALAGTPLDDVIRGSMSIATGLWLVAALVRRGLVEIDETAGRTVPSRGGPAAWTQPWTELDGLIDPRPVDSLIDWSAMADVLAARTYAPRREFHQSYDTLQSLKRRLAVMEHYNDLSGRTILQLGDDELYSVALAMVDDVTHVYAVDADQRILDRIEREGATRGLRLSGQRVDLRRERPVLPGIETFYVSGLKDAGGLRLFATTAIAAARDGAAGYVSFDPDVYRPGMSDRDVLRDVAKFLAGLDCVVVAQLPVEDLMLPVPLRSSLARIAVRAVERPDFAAVAGELQRLAAVPDADAVLLKEGFPHIGLRSATVVRVETGPDSRRLAERQVAILQRLAAASRPSAG